MELKVYAEGEKVGICQITDQGLYWRVHCVCERCVSHPVRLFGAGYGLGIPEPVGNQLVLDRKLAKSCIPSFQSMDGCILLPVNESSIDVYGNCISGYIEKISGGIRVYVSRIGSRIHPCLPLLCFWKLYNGFWVINLDENRCPVFDI